MNNTHGDTLYSPSTTGDTPLNKTIGNYQPPHGEVGWICPVCGRGLAPSTSYCPCNLTRNITYLNGGVSVQDMTINCKSKPPEAYYTTATPNGENWIKADVNGGSLKF